MSNADTAVKIIWFAVFQYCFVRVLMTLVAVFSQAIGRYCIESLNPAFAHIWVRPAYRPAYAILLMLIACIGNGNRRRLRHNCHVLPHPILHPAKGRPERAPTVTQGGGDQARHFSVVLAKSLDIVSHFYRGYQVLTTHCSTRYQDWHPFPASLHRDGHLQHFPPLGIPMASLRYPAVSDRRC